MARSKTDGIVSLDENDLPEGITIKQREEREQRMTGEGDDRKAVVGNDGKPVWDSKTVRVFSLTGADGVISLQKHINEYGPEGYDGNRFLVDLCNSHLAKYTVGSEIAVAAAPRYMDSAAAAGNKLTNALRKWQDENPGKTPDSAVLAQIFAGISL